MPLTIRSTPILRSSLSACGLLAALVLGGRSASASPPASQADKRACADAYTDGQQLRRQGRLSEARERLRVCARDVCTKIQTDCVAWIADLDRTIPSIVLRVHDGQDHDLPDVTVSLDGQPLVGHLDGRPLDLDPGEHNLRFERDGALPVATRVLIAEGEKDRAIVVAMPALSASAAVPLTAPPAPPPLPARLERPVPWTVYALGGVTVIGLASFSYFGLTGRAKYFDLAGCRGSCAPADVDAVRRSFLIGDISFGVSLVALAGAAYIYFSRPEVAPRTALNAGTLPHGAWLSLGRSF